IRACFEHVNALGGVNGRKLELVARDDGYDPTRALTAVKELIDGPDRKVFALLGNVGTPTAAMTAPYAVENKGLFFGAYTGAGLLRLDPPDRYVFNYRASYQQETEAMVNYLTNVREPKVLPQQIAVLAQGTNDAGTMDSYGQSGFDGVANALHGIVDASQIH